jgi:5-methylcytosine-specific restriction protein A
MDFYGELQEIFFSAEKQGLSKISVNSGELHRRVGGYPGPNHRMPSCCSAMRSVMRYGDRITQSPPKGNGASLTIEYQLPRAYSQNTHERRHEKTSERERTHEQQKSYTTPQAVFAFFNCPFPCDVDQLRKAYLEMIKQYHPDKVNGMGTEIKEVAEKKTKEINDMYERALSYIKG